MNKTKEIITAPFTEIARLLNNNYVCVSIVGKVYRKREKKEELERITALNVHRHYYHIRAKDWYACNLLYREILEKKGIERLKADLNNLLLKHNKSKIALFGYGVENEFCYRHILSDYLNVNGVNVTELKKVDLNIQIELWNLDQYKAQGHFNLTDEFVGKTLEKSDWIFAKTMPKNPHFYTLRANFGNNELFLHIVSHIRFFGKVEVFEGMLYRVFCYNGYSYWDHPSDILNEDCDLINRKPILNNTKSDTKPR